MAPALPVNISKSGWQRKTLLSLELITAVKSFMIQLHDDPTTRGQCFKHVMLSVMIYLLLCWMSLCWVSFCWMVWLPTIGYDTTRYLLAQFVTYGSICILYFIKYNVHTNISAHLNFAMIFGKKIIFIFQEQCHKN
jgi:hypothetical protein